MSGSDELGELRDELFRVDLGLVELAAARQAVSRRIGELKQIAGIPIRDFEQEKEVIDRARRLAAQAGLSSDLAEHLMALLIRSSLTVQEQGRVQAGAGGGGRRVLVIGGAGKMGGWFVRFLTSQGFTVEVADPAGTGGVAVHYRDWTESALDQDIIVVAAPLRPSAAILEDLAENHPGGLVFDVGSLKMPLRGGLKGLAAAGVKVTSLHPMFGPDTELLSGRHVIFVDVGVEEATVQARELFASTMAIQVEMDLDSHDRLIAYVLGLSHALNIAFFTALAESGETAPQLAQLSSTTFDEQLAVATRVAAENPHLYFEIQSLNEYRDEPLAALVGALERLRAIVSDRDEDKFAALMEQGREYLKGARRV